MSTLIHADIFFFVTTIAVVLIGLLFIVVIIYVVRILNDMRYISGVVRKETDILAEDLEGFRDKVKSEGFAPSFFSFIAGLFKQARGKRSKEGTHKSKPK